MTDRLCTHAIWIPPKFPEKKGCEVGNSIQPPIQCQSLLDLVLLPSNICPPKRSVGFSPLGIAKYINHCLGVLFQRVKKIKRMREKRKRSFA